MIQATERPGRVADASPDEFGRGAGKPISISHCGTALPRPVASTTRSASISLARPELAGLARRTPVMLSPSARKPMIRTPSKAVTFGRARTRLAIVLSRSGRLIERKNRSLSCWTRQPPDWCQARSRPALRRMAPAARSSSQRPGSRASAIIRPRASRACRWLPCGTPLRGSAAVPASSSRSIRVTCSNRPQSLFGNLLDRIKRL